jgi:HlyD family type I secretion membrane fusion protein
MNALLNHEQSQGITRSGINKKFDPDVSIARTEIAIGMVVVALFVCSAVGWAGFVPLSSASIATGVIGKDGYRKTIQHLGGGIIHTILVKDGSTVTAGQTLIELIDVQARSKFELLYKQKVLATVKASSLLAEQSGQSEVIIPEWLDLDSIAPQVRVAVQGHIDAAKTGNTLHQKQLKILAQRIQRAKQKIEALHQENVILTQEGELIREEVEKYIVLVKKGIVTETRVFELKRARVSNQAKYSANKIALVSTHQEIHNLEMEKVTLITSRTKKIVDALDHVREQLVRLDEKLSATKDTLERTVIRAPISGVVVNLRVHTEGGVITSGQPLLDIVPSSGNLIVEARINPMDRDTVRVGQNAEVQFSAFNQRVTEAVQGRVAVISADRLIDPISHEPFYLAKIELLGNPEDMLNGAPIYPGMQAEVLIITGTRTAFSYVFDPIVKSFNRAFRED